MNHERHARVRFGQNNHRNRRILRYHGVLIPCAHDRIVPTKPVEEPTVADRDAREDLGERCGHRTSSEQIITALQGL